MSDKKRHPEQRDDEIRYREIMNAIMEPDVYGSNPMSPRWRCSTDGDMGDEVGLTLIEFAASTFPPGTTVQVQVPCCPDCGMEANHRLHNCECGFDWRLWAENEFS